MLRTVNCGVDTNLLFARAPGERAAPACFTLRGKAQSFTWTSEKPSESAKFDGLIRDLPMELIRAKGFVRFEDGGRLFNYVAGRADFEEFNVDRTELVFIGRNLDILRPEIEEMLRGCEAE